MKKCVRELAQLKLCSATVKPSRHLTDLLPCVQAFCFAVVVSTIPPAHGQTPGPTSASAIDADRQINGTAIHKKRAIDLKVDTANATRFRLPQGVTSFVIPLPASNQRRCFTLESENVAAKGALSIATASKRLAVNDANWTVVAGTVRFQQKRQFYLSLVGVDAKFVRLTFQIDRLGKTAQPD